MNKTAKNVIAGIVILGAALVLWINYPYSADFLPVAEGRNWVQIDPIQCGGNPWEVWQNEQGVAYDLSEEGIIKLYFQEKESIEVFKVKSRQTHEIVCEACSCPRGDTIYLLVASADIQKMQSLGYSLSG